MNTIRTLTAAPFLIALASAANAHTALVSHDHPHGLSPLLGLETLAIAAAFVAVGLAVYGYRRRSAAKGKKD